MSLIVVPIDLAQIESELWIVANRLAVQPMPQDLKSHKKAFSWNITHETQHATCSPAVAFSERPWEIYMETMIS